MPIASQILACLSIFYYVILGLVLGNCISQTPLLVCSLLGSAKRRHQGKVGRQELEKKKFLGVPVQYYSSSRSWVLSKFAAPRTRFLELSPRGVDTSPVGPFLRVSRFRGPHPYSFVPLIMKVNCLQKLQISWLSQYSLCDLSNFQHLSIDSLY